MLSASLGFLDASVSMVLSVILHFQTERLRKQEVYEPRTGAASEVIGGSLILLLRGVTLPF